MEDRRQPDEDLAKVLAALERERTAAADLNSALIASESRVASLERRLRENAGAAPALDELRAQLAEQCELAEKYRIEAVEAQTMFDAMQHRIDTLSTQVAALKESAAAPLPEAVSSAELDAARAEAARLVAQLAERETALTATRRARDQWLERLEQSGRERERLRDRLAERERHLAALEQAAAGLEAAERRVRDLEAELSALRAATEEHGATAADAAERAAELERLRAELRQTEEVWERAETEKESLAEELAAARLRIDGLEEAARTQPAAAADDEVLERLRQDVARSETEREELRRENGELHAQIERVEAALVEQAAAREELEQELAASHARASEAEDERARMLADELESARRAAAAAADELSQLRERDAAAAALLAKLDGAVASLQASEEEQSRLAGQASGLGAEVGALTDLLAEVRQQMRAEGESLAAVEKRLEAGVALRGELEEAQRRGAELERERREADEVNGETARRRAELDAEVERLRAAVQTLEEERDALNDMAASRARAEDELRAEVERLQALFGAENSREDELEAMRRQIEELAAERDQLVAGHSSEVRGYRDEIAQHVEAIGQRESELDRLVRECSTLQSAVDEAIGELEGIRGERENLQARLSALDQGAPGVLDGLRDLEALIADAEPQGDVEADIEEVARLAAEVVPAAPLEVAGAPFVVHFDGSQECRAAIESAVAKVRGARCRADGEVEVPSGMRPVLAFNLATDSVDPLTTLAAAAEWGIEGPRALVYCVKGDRGVFFGRVEFFPAPCDPRECARRLLDCSDGSLQRLLAVGEEVDLMSGLREEMGRNRCSTAIAFDGRQAMDLIPMVKPQIVLVDLNLPRGDGLRVATQLRANPETANLSVAMFWSKPIDPLVFRQQAIYAMRDFTLSQSDLTRKFADALHRFDEPLVSGGAKTTARGRSGSAAR